MISLAEPSVSLCVCVCLCVCLCESLCGPNLLLRLLQLLLMGAFGSYWSRHTTILWFAVFWLAQVCEETCLLLLPGLLLLLLFLSRFLIALALSVLRSRIHVGCWLKHNSARRRFFSMGAQRTNSLNLNTQTCTVSVAGVYY